MGCDCEIGSRNKSEGDALKAVVDIMERMFLDDDKDVTFELMDGQEYAHKAVLKASSEAWGSMLASEMKERNGVIKLPDVNCVAMRVFLRLLYTGHVNPEDWASFNKKDACSPTAPPLSILLTVVLVAKRYMVSTVLSLATQALKSRLGTAKRKSDVVTFETIFASAIAADVGALRLAALDLGRSFDSLRTKYMSKELRPEVQFELEAIWSTPPSPSKRIRLE